MPAVASDRGEASLSGRVDLPREGLILAAPGFTLWLTAFNLYSVIRLDPK